MPINPSKYSRAIRAVRHALVEHLSSATDAEVAAHWRAKLDEHVDLAHETAAWLLREAGTPLLAPDPCQFVRDCGVEFSSAHWARWHGMGAERSGLWTGALQ